MRTNYSVLMQWCKVRIPRKRGDRRRERQLGASSGADKQTALRAARRQTSDFSLALRARGADVKYVVVALRQRFISVSCSVFFFLFFFFTIHCSICHCSCYWQGKAGWCESPITMKLYWWIEYQKIFDTCFFIFANSLV